MLRYLVPALVFAACAAPEVPDDAEAEAAGKQAAGKADAADFTGIYRISVSTRHANDLPSLELTSDGTYIRSRCYHASCSLEVPETDQFDQYTSSSGRTYVRFWTVDVWRDSHGDLQSEPVIADTYEIRPISKGVELRKTRTSRWFSLFTAGISAICAGSGGTFAGSKCTCPSEAPLFIPGAGGCLPTPGASEDNCDTSDGLWTDDDATAIGTFCVCGAGRYNDDTGSCAAI